MFFFKFQDSIIRRNRHIRIEIMLVYILYFVIDTNLTYRSDVMKKNLIVLVLLFIFSGTAFLIGCSSNKQNAQNTTPQPNTQSTTPLPNTQNPTPPSNTTTNAPDKVFTVEKLKAFNGQNGQSAYVAVNGIVYDVTKAKKWRNGKHEDGIVAGVDLTNMMSQSPHGNSVLNDVPVVGKLQ